MADPNLFYREFELDRKKITDPDKKRIELTFSSENPVDRWFGKEILMHNADNLDLSRLNSALFNHNPDQIIGRVEDIRIERKKTKGTIVFDDDELSQQVWSKVQSGSLKGTSIGYAIQAFKELQKDETWRGYEGPAYVATKWAIHEVTLTPIPADSTVGIGRAMSRSLDGIEIDCEKQNIQGDSKMTDEELKKFITETVGASMAAFRAQLEEDARPKLRVSIEQAKDLAARASAVSPECELQASRMVFDGKTEPEILRFITDEHTKKTDARNHGTNSPDGTGLPAKSDPSNGKRSMKDISVDLFARSISNPAAVSIQ